MTVAHVLWGGRLGPGGMGDRMRCSRRATRRKRGGGTPGTGGIVGGRQRRSGSGPQGGCVVVDDRDVVSWDSGLHGVLDDGGCRVEVDLEPGHAELLVDGEGLRLVRVGRPEMPGRGEPLRGSDALRETVGVCPRSHQHGRRRCRRVGPPPSLSPAIISWCVRSGDADGGSTGGRAVPGGAAGGWVASEDHGGRPVPGWAAGG